MNIRTYIYMFMYQTPRYAIETSYILYIMNHQTSTNGIFGNERLRIDLKLPARYRRQFTVQFRLLIPPFYVLFTLDEETE